MLDFTFGIVSDRYEVKKALVRDEANTIRAVWQRSDFIPGPDQTVIKALIDEYLDLRITVAQSHDQQLARSQIREGKKLQRRMWELGVKHGSTDLNSDIGALLVESINELATLQANRFSLGVEARVPTAIWFVLVSMLVLGMAAVGYHTAIAESRRPRITFVLAVSFSLVIALIAILDNPMNKILGVTQQPMIDLQSEIDETKMEISLRSTGVR
jgi:hypothetical protein